MHLAWMAGTKKWERTLLYTGTPIRVREAVSAVASSMATRLTATDSTVISLFRRPHGLGCTVTLWSRVCDHQLQWLHAHKMWNGLFLLWISSKRCRYYRPLLSQSRLVLWGLCTWKPEECTIHMQQMERSEISIMGGLIRQFDNLQEDRIFGLFLGEEFHVERNLRVEVTVSSTNTCVILSLWG